MIGLMINESVDAEPVARIGDERSHAAMEEVVLTASTATSATTSTATTTHSTTTSSSSSSLRRLACDACRARKVRCDRQDPPCSRCAKVGVTCRYSSRSKPTPSKMDLSKFLVTLNNRLKQAEAQLASTHLMQQNPQHFPMAWGDVDLGPPVVNSSPTTSSPREVTPPHLSGPGSTYDLHKLGVLGDKVMNQQNVTDWCKQTSATTTATAEPSEFSPFDAFTTSMSADMMMSQAMPESNPFEFEPMFFDISSSSTSQSVHTVSATILQGLYDRYFDVFHPMIPIINRSRFQHEISQPSPSVEVQALSYAIGTLTAFSVPELQYYVDHYYEQARNLLDICERQESGDSLSSINIMQASVVLTLYELKQPNFARAWLSLGRAIRLSKMMGLDSEESDSSMSSQWGLRKPLVQRSSPADQEERRRVFWSLFIFDSFASLRVSAGPAFDGAINVLLPSPSEYPDYLNEKMPDLQQVFELTETAPISSFAANAIVISLYQQYYSHIQSSYSQASHTFWETYYAIDKSINHCRTTLLAQHMNGSNHPPSIALRMNLNTIKISLHETALIKVEKDKLPVSLAADAISQCVTAVDDIVKAIQLGMRLTGNKLETFRQLDRFLVWPITTSIQVCFRMLYNGEDDATPYINSLRVLSNAMKELIDPEHIAPGLLEKAEARVAEAAQTTRKKRTLDVQL
ncbi:fungal-specific transcription factor domain-containing protein [Trichoderma novae-zelandiae]